MGNTLTHHNKLHKQYVNNEHFAITIPDKTRQIETMGPLNV